ncbi:MULTISPECIES: flagellar motor protein MotS [Oceanobacillus]|uniref:OmpA-like domain-containing protein n=1 Tax=Oceanobacillus kimchii TaxID=746691 RepID=A0ABQ5TMS5_9BACI|nr:MULTISPECIES: flagellar motor protein MotS [Oceanobacillus]MBT2600777.1 flagellar motor protein MotB [Oceanobacillus sp. ISL-74]MBT2650826.1 flagellar motor protein MotB [Oceanobacillus sp. ISL-73]MCT1575532.1 flagellar motor protein MotB [Oceanobacillus kimchii]MCT2137163.1 flagellar motor protein MotB [Oceanobacillus kimchii]OEH55348.1 flagellar motor protein MotS [Oceanobacillus sp. E9]
MKRRSIRQKTKKGAPKWMVTYSDMITLILVFFILLFSMSQIDQTKFDQVTESFQNRMILDFLPSAVPLDHPTENTGEKSDNGTLDEIEPIYLAKDEVEDRNDELDDLMMSVSQYLEENNLNDVITANRNDRGVVLVLQEKILFKSGEAEILEEAGPFLNHIGSLLSDLPNQVKVEGHTDSRPISNYRYPSNWELSGARASSVVRYLIEAKSLHMERFSTVGYADTVPLEPNTSESNMSKNRRVEIIILDNE